MNTAILRGILVVIIAISLFMMFTTDSPYSLATLGIAIFVFLSSFSLFSLIISFLNHPKSELPPASKT